MERVNYTGPSIHAHSKKSQIKVIIKKEKKNFKISLKKKFFLKEKIY